MTEFEYSLMQDLEKVRAAISVLRSGGSGELERVDDMIADAYSKLLAVETEL